MHLLSTFLSAAALATAVNAITFQTCQAKDFNNCKARMKINLGECYDLWNSNDNTWSVYADPGFNCYIWKDYYCSGDQGGPVTSNDAYRDLSISGWENQLSSFKCEAM